MSRDHDKTEKPVAGTPTVGADEDSASAGSPEEKAPFSEGAAQESSPAASSRKSPNTPTDLPTAEGDDILWMDMYRPRLGEGKNKETLDLGGYSREEVGQMLVLRLLENRAGLAALEKEFAGLGIAIKSGNLRQYLQNALTHGWLRWHPSRVYQLESRLRNFFLHGRFDSETPEVRRADLLPPPSDHDSDDPTASPNFRAHLLPRRLNVVRVVQSAVMPTVARAAADAICLILRDLFTAENRPRVVVGFAGGNTPYCVAHYLARRLADAESWLGRAAGGERPKLVVRSIVGAMNCKDPSTDPNAFAMCFYQLKNQIEAHVELEFDGLTVPALVADDEAAHVERLSIWRIAVAARDEIDVAVVSCGHFKPGCGSTYDRIEELCAKDASGVLKKRFDAFKEDVERRGVQGDFGWRFVGRTEKGGYGEIGEESVLRIMSLFDMKAYQDLVRPQGRVDARRKRVVLVVAPCSGRKCGNKKPWKKSKGQIAGVRTVRSKGEILRALLSMDPPPFTDVVADARSVEECLDLLKNRT